MSRIIVEILSGKLSFPFAKGNLKFTPSQITHVLLFESEPNSMSTSPLLFIAIALEYLDPFIHFKTHI
jgi:hypothetical protein